MRKVLGLLLLAFCLVLPASAPADQGERRIALVIGVGDYGPAQPGFVVPPTLTNARKDAALVATALAAQGFEVQTLENPDKRAMRLGIQDFADRLKEAGPNAVGFFYFSGHGAQGRPNLERDVDNYLIPKGAALINEADLDSEAIGLRLLSSLIAPGEHGAVVIVLDACRDFALPQVARAAVAKRGLAEAKAAPGTLIAYSTAPGKEAFDGDAGGNGPYAKALAAHLKAAQGDTLEQVFYGVRADVLAATGQQQLPWENSSLLRAVTFGEAAGPKKASPEELNQQAQLLLVSMGYPPDGSNAFRTNVGYPPGAIDEQFVGALRLFAGPLKHRAPGASAPAVVTNAVAALLPKAEDVTLRLDPGMHTAPIKRIAVTADGRTLATASDDKTVKLWALPEGRLIRTLRPPIGPGNEGKVYAVAIDPAGRWVAAGGWTAGTKGDFVMIFDAASGATRARIGPLPDVIDDLAVSLDGARVAAGLHGANGVRVWEAPASARGRALTPAPLAHAGERWRLVLDDKAYGDTVYGVDFAADGRLAATSFDGQLRLYGPDLKLIAKVKAPGGAQPFGIAFSPDQRALAVGYNDSTRVDVLDGRTLAFRFVANTEGIVYGDLSRVVWRADGALAAGGRYTGPAGDQPVLLWPDGGRGTRRALSGPDDTVFDLLPAGGAIAFGAGEPAFGVLAADGTRTLFRGPVAADLRNKTGPNFLVSPDGTLLRFGLKPFSKSPVLFDLAGRALTDSPATPAGLAQPDVSSLAVAGWENGTAPTLNGARLALKPYERARSLAIAPDAQSLVLGTEWYLRRFGADGKQIWQKAVPDVAWGVNLAREGRLVIAAYGDGTIRWHRADTGEELLALFIYLPQGPTGPRDWILFTPKGYYEASSPAAEKLIGWHVNRGDDQAADFFPVETFAKTFHRPDIIAHALDGI